MQYPFRCLSCGKEQTVERSIVEGPPGGVPCDGCQGGWATRVWTVPEVHVPGKPIDCTHLGANLGERVGRTPAQQERIYGNVVNSLQKLNREKRRSLSRRAEGKTEIKAEIPRELYVARQRQFGKDYWKAEGDRALRRDGLV